MRAHVVKGPRSLEDIPVGPGSYVGFLAKTTGIAKSLELVCFHGSSGIHTIHLETTAGQKSRPQEIISGRKANQVTRLLEPWASSSTGPQTSKRKPTRRGPVGRSQATRHRTLIVIH